MYQYYFATKRSSGSVRVVVNVDWNWWKFMITMATVIVTALVAIAIPAPIIETRPTIIYVIGIDDYVAMEV